ncbi:40709_t:CDS:2, partial [Gigaspora margarita]
KKVDYAKSFSAWYGLAVLYNNSGLLEMLEQESIESFLKGQDTLTILPTGAGKTLIFSAASILTKALTVSELVKIGIPAATIYASLDQPLEVQKKIFGKVAAGITKVLWITPEKFIKSLRFCRFLDNVFQTRGIQFVIDKTHCVLEFEHFRLLGIYHKKMRSIDQKTILHLWHNQELKYIIVTNAFEIGQAGRDGQPYESIVFYTRTDICDANEPNMDAESNPTEMQAVQNQYSNLKKQKKNIFAIAYIFEDSYQCCQKIAYEPFRWPEDIKIPECGICDNCKRCIADRIVWYNISEDLLQILDTVDQLVEFANDLTIQLIKFGRDDIVDVFMKAINKNTKKKFDFLVEKQKRQYEK